MRFIALLMLIAFPFFSNGQSIMDVLKRSGELYDEGTKYFASKEYMIADSLYAESLKLYPHPDTYYNRAVARKHLGDMSGFAQNLEQAMGLGDTTAGRIYYKQCVVADTFFLTQDNKKASVFDFHRCLIFRKSKYTSYQEVHRFDSSGEIDLKYVVKGIDTVYYTIPKWDSVSVKSLDFFNRMIKNLKYPTGLRDQGVAGEVWINLLIDKDGSINEVVVVKSNALAFSAAVITAIQQAGKSSPVYHEERPVKMKVSLPIIFSIQEDGSLLKIGSKPVR